MADQTMLLEGRSSRKNTLLGGMNGVQSMVTTPSTATESEISTPPTTPSSASNPSHTFLRPNSSHSSINSKLLGPTSPPPSAPLPAIPLPNQHPNLIPFKPKLLPKRGLSRSPSPIVRTEPRQTYETKASRDEIFRARELARSRKQEQMDEQGYSAANEMALSSSGSKSSSYSPREKTFFGDGPIDIDAVTEISSPTSFNFLNGPLLLSDSPARRSESSNRLRMAAAAREPVSPSRQRHDLQFVSAGPSIRTRSPEIALAPSPRSAEMALSLSADGRIKVPQQKKKASRPKTAPQKRTNSSGDVVMRELGSSADEEYTEPEYETVPLPRIVNRKVPRTVQEAEPSWADDASVIDMDEEQYSQAAVAPEEIFEVAALRRQVEQLQMALKKQMATKETGLIPPSRSSATSDRYPYGMPTPDPSSRDGSSISGGGGGAGSFRPSPSSSRSIREQHLAPSAGTHYGSDQASPSMLSSSNSGRRGSALRSPQKQYSSDHYSVPSERAYSRSSRVISDNASSIMADESASMFVGEEDIKLEDLARKIQALEAMFRVSNISPSGSSIAGSSQHTQRQQQFHGSEAASVRSIRPRRASLATISTIGDDGANGRRSPAASAYNFNATSPYDAEQASTMQKGSSLMSRHSNGSSNSIDKGERKGVARFIMGVGTSKGNVPRDEHGNPLPSMQVSWSRKRNEKIAKPVTKAKMTVGPGRGRIVLQPKPSS